MSPEARRFLATIETPPGYSLGPMEERAVGEAFDRWQQQDLVERMISMKPRRLGVHPDKKGET